MTNDKSKLTFILSRIAILLALSVIILVCFLCMVEIDKNRTQNDVQTYAMPERITFTSEQLNASARSGETTSVRVRANVEPYNATNTKVDFAASWKNAPSSYTENVSEYVTVRQESDGSQTATITCIKPFTQYNVVITVTTRDGGYTAECLCTFSGKATELSLSVDGKQTTTDNDRGTYYLLDSKSTATVRIHPTNVYDYVPNTNYSISVNVPDVSLWFGDCDYGEYGETYFSAVRLEKLRDKYAAGKLFTVGSVSNGAFTITTNKSMEYGAETVETTTDEYGSTYRHGKGACVYDPYDMGLGSTNYVEDIHGKNDYNVGIIDKLCYEITVTERISGVSETLRFWVSI